MKVLTKTALETIFILFLFFSYPTLQELNLVIGNVIYTPLNVSFTAHIFDL